MASDFETRQEILKIHSQFWHALAERDLNKRFSLCADDITFIGTGLYERARNKQEYRAINQKGIEQYPNAFKIEILWTDVAVFENVAWVESEVIWIQNINENVTKELVRNTTILKHEQDKWWVVHVHGSVPDYRLHEGEYMTNERTITRNRELEQEVFERTQELKSALENLKATQAQLIQSEKMASLGELTAGIAHEIQNPLNFINNFAEVNSELMEEIEAAAEKGNLLDVKTIIGNLKENEEKIISHGHRADAIVKAMLQHSRKSTGKKELTNLNELVDEFLRLSYHGLRARDKSFRASFETDFDEAVGKIEVIPQDLGRVLLNLFNNAFYAVNEKQKQSDESFEPNVVIRTKKLADKIEVTVKDNGPGIPQKALDKIFQPFFTTKPAGEGTGLGLSLSYDVIKAHGGELKVETKEGEFAEFIIELPLHEKKF